VQVKSYLFKAANGWSEPLDTALDSPGTLIMAFASPDLKGCSDALVDLRRSYPQSVFTGCSTAGEILDTPQPEPCIAVTVVRFEHARVRGIGVGVHMNTAYAAGAEVAAALAAPDLKGIFVISEGLDINGSELARGLSMALPTDIPITGALAGDGERFRDTWVLDEDAVQRAGYMRAVGFYGEELDFSWGSGGGWNIFGPERLVTRSEHNVLYELDGKPALALYRKYLGNRASLMPAIGLRFPLAIQQSAGDTGVIRTILGIDEEKQALIFAGDIPQGSVAQLAKASIDDLVDGARQAVGDALEQTRSPDLQLAIIVSCVGRRMVMGAWMDDEIEVVRNRIGPHATAIGFYSYGELAPQKNAACAVHNQTLTITVLQERA